MYARALTFRNFCTLAGVFSLIFVSSGCEGDSGGGVTDASFERPTAMGGAGGGGGGGAGGAGGTGGQTVDARVAPDSPPPVPNTASIKILPGQTDLLGSFQTGCSFGPGAERWCAVSRQVTLAQRDFRLVNVTKAAANRTLLGANDCNQAGLCITLAANLYTDQPQAGPAYPEDSARASGNSFIYLSDSTSAAGDAFQGKVSVHTIGASNATVIGEDVFDCAVAGQRYIDGGVRVINKVVGICAGNPSSGPQDAVDYFTLLGGVVPGQEVPQTPTPALPTVMTGKLPEVQRIYPVNPETMSTRWRVGFSPDSETLILSAGGASQAEVEKLTTIRTDDIGKNIPMTPFPGGEGATRWSVSPDGRKIYYLTEYNYNAQGSQSGTLNVADFPTGANAKALRGTRVPGGNTTGIGSYRLLTTEAGAEAGVGYLSGLVMGRGAYSIIKNVAGSMDDVANVVNIVNPTRSLPLPSPDLRFSLYAAEFNMDTPTSDIWVTRNDGSGSGSTCNLTGGTLGGVFGFPFTRDAGLMFWADAYDPTTFAADGWLTDPNDCGNNTKKRKFASGVDFWFVDSSRMLLYSDESTGTQVSLKYAFVNGGTLSAPVTIQTRADRFFQIVLDTQPTDGSLPRFKGVLYKLTGGGDAVNGIYYYELPANSAAPSPDAGATGG